MKIININQFNEFANYHAIFFTEEGIIIDQRTQSPFMNFLETSKKLEIHITAIYMDGSILIVSCDLPANIPLINQFNIYPVKNFLAIAQENIQGQILRAIHWLTWNNKAQYCSACGDTLSNVPDVMEKKCRSCGASFFPNLSPAIMVLVQKEHQILLARSPHFKPGIYSVIAGFVDIGESAEEAVYREVKEEVGIEISQLTYFGSQSWPFPNSFMMAFTAHTSSEKLIIDPNEIEDAKWFDVDNLPAIPSYPSISRKLIESWRMRMRQ
jgi:NAD+ diphosphatase